MHAPACQRMQPSEEHNLQHVPTSCHLATAEFFQVQIRDPMRKPQNTLYCSQTDDMKQNNYFPLSQKKLVQCSQWLTGFTAVLRPMNENKWSPSKRVVADEAISHILSFLRYEKELVIYLTYFWHVLLTSRRNSEPFISPVRESRTLF